ncbi:MAG TPA: copper transporter [Streptosporangiaceae bacterium]|nr:copper transporter [Streptosporangiaceae bacterium]
MIDFRYHLVSIVAVFLALAIGIVLGAVALQPKVANTLHTESERALKQNDQLNAEISKLKAQVAADGQFGVAAAGILLPHLLQGEKVVLVTAPGADGSAVSGITSALLASGATLTGTVSLAPQFFDTDAKTQSTLITTAGQVAPPGVPSTGQAGTQLAGQQAAAKVIAATIMDRNDLRTATAQEVKSVLNEFGDQGFLQVSNPSGGAALTGQADLAVVVIPGTTPANASSVSPENLTLVSLTRDFGQSGEGALLAGSLNGSGNGSAIEAVTGGGAGEAVITVDNADTEIGQIIVIQALREALEPHAIPRSYGVGPDAAPSPAPSTSPTPSVSASPSHSPQSKAGKGKS